MNKIEKRHKIEEYLSKIEEIIGKPDCESCTHKCCLNSGYGVQRGPVIDSTYDVPKEYIKYVRVGLRKIPVMKTKNNACIWFNFENGKCSHYENRLLECRLYPVTLDEYGKIAINRCPGIKDIDKSDFETVKKLTMEIFSLDKKFYKRLKAVKSTGGKTVLL